jgi:hypothetical protein
MKLTKLLENEFTNKAHSSDTELYLSLKLKSESLTSEITHLYQRIVKVGETLQVSQTDAGDVAMYAENSKISAMWDGLTPQQQQLYFTTKKTCKLLRTLSIKQKDAKEDFLYVDNCINSNIQIDQHKLHSNYTYDNSNY